MADLTEFAEGPIVTAIYAHYERQYGSEELRPYLGASSIGKECRRALWYDFRWASREQFDGRMLRLFQTGHLAESRFVADLRAIDVEVYDVDPATSKQFGFSDHGGHARGHMDGCARHVPGGGKKWHVTEYKTHAAKSFAALKKDGVKKSKPQHYAQMTWYMGQSGMDRALYLAVNKDTDDLYAERIEFDATEYEKIQAKFDAIIFAAEPPAKISEDPKYYICNMCSHKDVCHGHRVPPVSCRTCVHATPERDGDGRWSCAKYKADIPIAAQRTGCDSHLPLPFLLTYADPMDAGDGWIEFCRKDNADYFVVAAPGVTHPYPHFPIYTSQEISAVKDHRVICDREIENFKTSFSGTIIS